jgi:hypothetical protein
LKITRMDLDGTGSPAGLVTRILKAEPALKPPMPVEELARQLDISEIRDLTTDGFEGGLITDVARSHGFILVNRVAIAGRRRFTIGHELGHFLLRHHAPPPGGFLCTRDDMRRWDKNEKSAVARMEVEANKFSAFLLMPPPMWKAEAAKFGDPNLSQIVALARTFAVSKEAAARTYAQYHDEAVAVVVVHNGVIGKIYSAFSRFPRLCIARGAAVPPSSLFHRAKKQLVEPSEVVEARAEFWLESEWGTRLPELYEQVFFQQGGFALILLWAESQTAEDDDWDPDAEKTAKERLRDRQARWSR